jgi:peptidoglycan/xylan/chitin deacetylase (PgdA/CDA1 family)
MVLLSPRRAVVHLDLDGARHIYRVHGWSYPATDDPLFETGLEAALELFARESIVATLFVIAEDLDDRRKRALLDAAVRAGHEIGSHSITHRRLLGLAPAERRREIGESRTRLEQALGVPVRGFRAPALDADRSTLDLVAEAGYDYDSSFFGGHAGSARRFGGPVPSVPFAVGAADLVELPLPRAPGLPLPFHPSYAMVLGDWYFRAGLARARPAVPAFVLLFHLTDFAEPLGSGHLGPWASRWFTLSHLPAAAKRAAAVAMIDQVRRGYDLVATRELLAASGQASTTGALS